MATKTYYGKLDCGTSVALAENLSHEYFTSFFNFMTYISASGVVSLVAMRTGSRPTDGTNYWDQANPFGSGSHLVYKWNTSSTRNWEWYMYAQLLSGTANPQAQNYNNPTAGYGNNADLAATSTARGILLAGAVCISGTTSFNPWNGTSSLSASSKGSPVWVSGANDRNLWVLPRSNGPLGNHATNRENCLTLGRFFINSDTALRFHFITDGDAFIALNDVGDVSQYGVSYLGPFELRNALTGSGIGNGRYGFMMMSNGTSNTNTLTSGALFGDTAGTGGTSNTTINGGIVFPTVTGSRTGKANTLASFSSAGQQLNTFTNQYDEFPAYVGMEEGANVGLLGNLNNGLCRYIVDAQSEDVTPDNKRAVFGGSTTVGTCMISVPWTGSFAPGTGTSRTGSNFTWTIDYG